MKHYKLDDHSTFCECHKDKEEDNLKKLNDKVNYPYAFMLKSCALNPVSFIFYCELEFYLVTYHKCLEYGSHLHFKEDLLNNFAKNIATNSNEIRRSYHLEDDLKEYRLRGLNLKTHISEINYIYIDNAKKPYCFSRDINYFKIDNSKMNDSYVESKEYLMSNGYKYLINSMDELLEVNTHNEISEIEIIKTTQHLVKTINKQLKQKL